MLDREDTLMRRALSAHYRTPGALIPASALSRIESHNGHEYVVLRNGSDTLHVYRVRNDGKLKALKRWPKAIKDA